MKARIAIPKGWRKLRANELLRKGDRRTNEEGTEWQKVRAISFGYKAGFFAGTFFMRRIAKKPAKKPTPELHNPDKLTPEQYGASEGYRLLTKREVELRGTCLAYNLSENIQVLCGCDVWVNGARGRIRQSTYRTRLSVAQLEKEQGLTT